MVLEGAVDRGCVGVEEELGRVEPLAVVWRVRAVGAVAVAGACGGLRNGEAVDAVLVTLHGQARGFGVAAGVVEAEFDFRGVLGIDGELGACRRGDCTLGERWVGWHGLVPLVSEVGL